MPEKAYHDRWMDDRARRGNIPAFVQRRMRVLERRITTQELIRAEERRFEFAANV